MNKVPVISIVDDDESGRIALSSLVRSMGCEPSLFPAPKIFSPAPKATARTA